MLITQCPDCHSLFRVSHGQLKLAEGKVRCGACLRVFDAREHALEKARPTAEPTPTTPPEPPISAPVEHSTSQQKTLEESATTHHTATNSRTNTARVVQFREKQREYQKTEIAAHHLPSASPEEQQELQAERQSESTPDEQPLAESAPSKPAFDPSLIPELNIAVEPIILRADPPEESSPGAVLFWMFASILALTALVSQYLWFERATLASQPNLTGLYQLACERIPCQLHSLEGLKTLEAEQVIVRPHQMFADLISLSIKLRNSAAFEQPYPAMEITFSDLKGDLVARRTFQPKDYLPAYQLGSSLPPGLDLEINLPLTDPGEKAISYTVELRQAR